MERKDDKSGGLSRGAAARSAIDGGRRMRRRAASPRDISEEQMTTFLATLADTCNVVRSARAAGFSANWAYCKRKTDASFRAGWRIAVREGYAKLELILLDRAMNGTVRRVPTQDGGERRIREYSNNLAIALLRRHAEAADDDIVPPDEVKDARDRILARLVGLKRAARAAQRDGAADETA